MVNFQLQHFGKEVFIVLEIFVFRELDKTPIRMYAKAFIAVGNQAVKGNNPSIAI